MDDETEKIEPMRLGPAVVQRIAAGRARVWLVSPYVTSDTAVEVLRDSDAPSKRLLTRCNVSDIVAGATDLQAIAALVAAGVDVRVLEDVHAKVYVVDEWAYVGSANLTTSGLEASLREFGITSTDVKHVREACAYFERVWNEARVISQEDMDSSLEQLEHIQSDLEAIRRVRKEAEKRLALTGCAPRAPVERMRTTHNATRDPLEETLVDLCGSVTVAQSIARVFAHAIRSVPNFATSEHWTINEPNDLLRLNVGMVEVLTMNSGGGVGGGGLEWSHFLKPSLTGTSAAGESTQPST